jgi:hypothetical protein
MSAAFSHFAVLFCVYFSIAKAGLVAPISGHPFPAAFIPQYSAAIGRACSLTNSPANPTNEVQP